MKKSENVGKLISSKIGAKRIMQTPEKDTVNPWSGERETSFEEILRVVESACLEWGIDMVVKTDINDEDINVTVTLWDESGEYIEYDPVVQPCYNVGDNWEWLISSTKARAVACVFSLA